MGKQDYAIEHGATRNFEAQRLVDEQEKKEQEKREEEESNPMKMLEKRTKDSKREMEMMEALEDLKELNDQKAGLHIDEVLKKMKIHKETDEERKKREEAEIEEEIKRIKCKRIPEIKDHNDLSEVYKRLEKKMGLKNDILGQGNSKEISAPPRKKLGVKLGIIKKKKVDETTPKETNKTEEAQVPSKKAEIKVTENKNDDKKVSGGATSLVGYAYSSSGEDSE